MEHAPQKIHRSSGDRVIAGVAGGIGEYLGVDAVLVRLAFVALTFVGGLGVAAYVLAWILVPEETGAPVTRLRRAAEPVRIVAVGLVLLGLLLLVRELNVWPGDSLVWPALLAAAGLALLWKRSTPAQRASLARSARELRARTLEPGAGERDSRASIARIAGGAVLLVAGISTFLAFSESAAAAGRGLAATAVVAAGLALIFLPWLRRLAHELAEERRERIRSQERAELAAHLHDSVLQTLALIQRRSGEPDTVVRLARRQERELRDWLFGQRPEHGGRSLAAALRQAGDEVEDLHGVAVEAVSVGDCALDEHSEALLAAAREAMVNAARLSGADRVDVYLEVGAEEIAAFVRDRGDGFDPDAVSADRKGITESIVGRMQRHGGSAAVHSTPGEGTEVEVRVPRAARAPEHGRPAG